MLFLHDVWVNWFEGEENGYNVCHFHEWRKEDTVELWIRRRCSECRRYYFIT